MTVFSLSRVSLATGTCYRHEISPVWFKLFNSSKQHYIVLKMPCLAQILIVAFSSEQWCHRVTVFVVHKFCCWHKPWKRHQNTVFSSLLHSARPLNYTLRWNWLNKLGSLQGCWPGSCTCTAASRQQEKTTPRPQLCRWEWLPTRKTSGKHCLSSSLVPLLLTPSTPSNHYDIWVPLCVSFLRSNHLNPLLKQSRPCWGTHNRCLSLAGQPWPQWHL